MLKIAIAAGLMAAPALLLAQPPEQMGNGMGTEADAAAHANGSSMSGMHSSGMHSSGMGSTMHHRHRKTTRDASLSRDTRGTENTSNSKSSTLNPMPH